METLGLSDSTQRAESRLKSLFWPSIESGADVDYLGTQGYWICTLVAMLNFIVSTLGGYPVIGFLILLFFYLGGVGVRERSRYAAAMVLIIYVTDSIASGIGVIRILFSALLLSNFRATWIAAQWRPESEEAAMPPRLGETWSDKFADTLPAWLWPKIRYIYYILSICFLVWFGIGILFSYRHRQ